MEAGKNTAIKGSSVIAKKNIAITGESVNIENTNSIYNAQEKHEYERSGLSVSVGGAAVEAAVEAVGHVERAHQVEDKRLAVLHGYEAYDTVKEKLPNLKEAAKNPSGRLSINVSFGSTKSRSESESTTAVSNGSQVKAEGDVTITSTQKDIAIKGSHVEGNDVTLNAKEHLNITASENSNVTKQDSKSSSASLGAFIGVGGLQGITAGYGQSEENIKENGTTYNESTVTADKKLDFTSGKDTNIQGGKVSGEKVTGHVGDDLNLESKQDSHSYEEENKSAGLNVDYALGSHKSGVGGGASRSDIGSHYSSVTDQSGIYAGSEGFTIRVEKNTDLKGAVIDSQAPAEKNHLTTGTLTWEDIGNKADYKAGGYGIGYSKGGNTKLNEKGLTPNITPAVKDKVDSTTEAGIAEGTITITDKDNQKQNIGNLNRDTKNSLGKLAQIFDKEDVKERQEMIDILSKEGNKAIHKLAESKGWEEGSTEKVLAHSALGAILGDLSGGSALTGAMTGGVSEYVTGYLEKTKGKAWMEGHPDAVQNIAAVVGGALGSLAGEKEIGAYNGQSGAKWNYYAFAMDQSAMLKRNLKRKDGKEMTDEEWEKLSNSIREKADEFDVTESMTAGITAGGNDVKMNVKQYLLKEGYTTDSVESYMNEYSQWADEMEKNQQLNVLEAPPVKVVADYFEGASERKGIRFAIKGLYGIGDAAYIIGSDHPRDAAFAWIGGNEVGAVAGAVSLAVFNYASPYKFANLGVSGILSGKISDETQEYLNEQIDKHRKNENNVDKRKNEDK